MHAVKACGTSCRWVFNFTSQLIYPWWKNPQYPLRSRLSGSQSLSRFVGEERALLHLLEIESGSPGCPACSLVTCWPSGSSSRCVTVVAWNDKCCTSTTPSHKCPVSIVTRQWARHPRNWGSISSRGETFFCSPKCRRPALGNTQFAIQ